MVEYDLDELRHANNISYMNQTHSAALAHSAAQGLSAEAFAVPGGACHQQGYCEVTLSSGSRLGYPYKSNEGFHEA